MILQQQAIASAPSKTLEKFESRIGKSLEATGIDVLQLNLGYRCNLTCKHCHVNAGPNRAEAMPKEIMNQCLKIIKDSSLTTIDITGGAPEMNPDFRWFINECAKLKRRLLVRTNAVILLEDGYQDIIDLYTGLQVELVVSLPCYTQENTDQQRGDGIFEREIQALKILNSKGYGSEHSNLILDLVYNPGGPFLPGSQSELERDYKHILKEKYEIDFNRLFCITNMPIGRYQEYLFATDNYEGYMETLVNAYNPTAFDNVMCKNTVSVGWDGQLYDCDFNQILGLGINHGAPSNIMNFNFEKLSKRQIVVGNHCYGCTAGAGSSCQGEVV